MLNVYNGVVILMYGCIMAHSGGAGLPGAGGILCIDTVLHPWLVVSRILKTSLSLYDWYDVTILIGLHHS